MPISDLDRFFAPRSIAIVGASTVPDRIGGLPLRFLRKSGFAGRIVPVNPSHREVQGYPAVARIEEIDAPIDLAVIALPAAQVPGTIESCAARHIPAAIVFSAGFAEIGGDGVRLQQRVAAIARAAGVRIVGPNCAGAVNFGNGAWVTFAPLIGAGQPRAGNVALITQSGAFANFGFATGRRRGVLFSKLLSTGNELDVTLAEGIAYAAGDPETDVILCYMEGCRDGPMLLEGLRAAERAGKPVVIVKVGRTAAGSAAAASHTAALAGADAVFAGLFNQYGVHRADTIEELFEIGYAFAKKRLPRGTRTALVSISGGVGVLMADEAHRRGLDVAAMPDAAADEIRAIVPFAATANPVDVTAQVINDLSLFERTLDVVLRSGRYDAVVAFLGYLGQSEAFMATLVPMWRALERRFPGCVIQCVSLFDEPRRTNLFEESDLLAFEDPSRALRALAALARFSSNQRALRVAREPATDGHLPLPAIVTSACRTLDEPASLALLAAGGIPVTRHRVVADARAAASAAQTLGFPAALKIVSRDIPHKSAVGGVCLNIPSTAVLEEAAQAMLATVHAARPDARLDGLLIAPMANPGFDAIAGVAADPLFGVVVMCGQGGTAAERLARVAFRIAPIDERDALAMIAEAGLAAAAIEPASDWRALAAIIVRLAEIGIANRGRFDSIDVNPVRVFGAGRGAVALDALIVLPAGS